MKKSNNKCEGKYRPCKSGIQSLCFHFVANKMDGYFQFSTKSIAKVVLLFILYNVRSVRYNM